MLIRRALDARTGDGTKGAELLSMSAHRLRNLPTRAGMKGDEDEGAWGLGVRSHCGSVRLYENATVRLPYA